jgi:hypothetical protein
MSYREMQKRLEYLESQQAQQQRAEAQAWVDSLTDEELEVEAAEAAQRDPVSAAAIDALSDADFDRLADGTMSEAEWQQHLRHTEERLTGSTL